MFSICIQSVSQSTKGAIKTRSMPRRCAILLIDVQQLWTDNATEFPSLQSNIIKLISLANNHSIPLIYIFGNEDLAERDLKWTNMNEKLAGKHKLVNNPPSLFLEKNKDYQNRLKKETIIKSCFNAFDGTNLHYLLQAKGISDVFVAGLLTSVCVVNTGHGAFVRSYYVHVIKDCCGDFSQINHQTTIDTYSKMMWTPLELNNLISKVKMINDSHNDKMRIPSKL